MQIDLLKKKIFQGKGKARHAVDLLAEPVYIETSERQQEENMMSVDVNKMHVQLRRLKNESVLLKDASITAVPNHRSKVSKLVKEYSLPSVTEHIIKVWREIGI